MSGFGILGTFIGLKLFIELSSRDLAHAEKTVGIIQESQMIDSTVVNHPYFKYTDSDYLGFKLESDSLVYALYHLNLPLKSLAEQLKPGDEMTLYYHFEPNLRIQSIAQLEKDHKILASFNENKSYLSKSYIEIFVVGLVFLVTGLIFLRKTINK